MESLDVWEPSSAIQPQAESWAAYPLDGYEPMLDEGVSDSKTSIDTKAQALFFENCDVKLENAGYEAMGASYAAVIAPQTDPMGWCYTGDESLSSVMTPTSESDDTMRYETVATFHESGDETTPSMEDTSSEDEEELQYSDHMEGQDDSDSASQLEINGDLSYASPLPKGSHSSSSISTDSSPYHTSSSGRPVRASARGVGEQLKQVQEMIRQVNSAVESGTPVTKGNRSSSSSPSNASSHHHGTPSPNNKKRSRVEPDLKSVTLSRDQLLTMTSDELDAFTERLKADHSLTPHELRELKRQRRLIKNREYAQASRVKKKVVLSDLGVKFNELESERNALAMRVQALEIENTELRRQLGLDASKRNLNQFIIGGSGSGGSSSQTGGFPHRASSTQSKGNSAEDSTMMNVSSSSTTISGGDGDYLFQPPKAKRFRGRQNSSSASLHHVNGPSAPSSFSSRAAVIGGGMSLFAIVLLAVAVFNGAGSPFFASPIGSTTPHGVPAMSNFPAQPQQQGFQTGFKSDSGYNTWRTMDILATSPEDNPTTLDPLSSTTKLPASTNNNNNPSDSIKSHIYQSTKEENMPEILQQDDQKATAAVPISTIVSMDELMAAEEIIFSTNNASLPEENILDDAMTQQQQQA